MYCIDVSKYMYSLNVLLSFSLSDVKSCPSQSWVNSRVLAERPDLGPGQDPGFPCAADILLQMRLCIFAFQLFGSTNWNKFNNLFKLTAASVGVFIWLMNLGQLVVVDS